MLKTKWESLVCDVYLYEALSQLLKKISAPTTLLYNIMCILICYL